MVSLLYCASIDGVDGVDDVPAGVLTWVVTSVCVSKLHEMS